MIIQRKIFEKNIYCVYVQFDDDRLDYYSDVIIKIKFNGFECIIYKDNLLYLKNLINNFKGAMYYIDDNLDEKNLGKLINIYYKSIDEELIDDRIITNEDGEWIGEKYLLFSSIDNATWLYRNQCGYTIKVTPIYSMEYEYKEKFEKFLINYNDTIHENLCDEDLKKIVSELLNIIKENNF